MMKAAKLFSILVFVLIGSYGAIGLYFLPLAGFEGDLTRVSKMPESLFGWTKPQPAIAPGLLKPASWQDADVLVIGDSFSETRVWQSVLVKNGLKVRTEHWTSIREGVCEDFYPWVRAQGFKGKWVIFEVVERNVEAGLPKSVTCKHVDYHPSVHADALRNPPLTTRPDTDRSGRLSVGIETYQNIMAYEKLGTQADFSSWNMPGGATLRRIANGCQLFSHAKCQDALFYSSDRLTDIGDSTLDIIQTLNSRTGDLKTLWVIMPDKSSVFMHPEKQFWNKMETKFSAPNILSVMQQALNLKTIDLYPANNSHLSTEGYLLLGDAVYSSMKARPN
ncbi:MAG: hypothetical protein PHY62_06040 [Gallionella sp.]|nr:hypothetical protein [Gallionella sp.]